MMEPEWGTKKTCFMSERMAKRVAAKIFDLTIKTAVKDLLWVATGKKASYNRPNWFPGKSSLVRYDDLWDDWEPYEIEVLVDRLQPPQNIPKRLLMEVLDVPDDVMKWVAEEIAEVPHTIRLTANTEDVTDVSEAFSSTDIPSDEFREQANQRWKDYSSRVDMTRPTNQVLVRSMIVYEVRMRKIQTELMTATSSKLKALHDDLKAMQTAYTSAAEDIAQLERQFDIRPEDESLDAVIKRTHDVRLKWRQENEMSKMAEIELIKLKARLHRVDLELRGDVVPEADLPHAEPDPDAEAFKPDLLRVKLSERNLEESPVAIS